MSGEAPKKKNSRAEFQSAMARLKAAAGKRRAMDRYGIFGATPDKKAVADAELNTAIECVRGFPKHPIWEELDMAQNAAVDSMGAFMTMDSLMRSPTNEPEALERALQSFQTRLETDEAIYKALQRVLIDSSRSSRATMY